MKIIGVIPARYASSRYPGKPLIDIGGKSMIQRVVEQARLCKRLHEVFVATDDPRIFDHVSALGMAVRMTSSDHQSGTDRCAEVANSFEDDALIINIQGDEPFIDPSQLDLLIDCFDDVEVHIATLIKKIEDDQELRNSNSPKVVLDQSGNALYFSRQVIPFLRSIPPEEWIQQHDFYKHIGLYAFKNHTLQQLTKLPVSTLEKAESLEQLRWLENGFRIRTKRTLLDTLAVDTPEDLNRIHSFLKNFD
jgi:3-deoxy-manno-octulosonate cytidylyltransferase (CMP-KDO synthetase)